LSFLLDQQTKEEQMNAPVSKVFPVRVLGPLASHAAGFKESLADSGYTPLSAAVQLRLMAHVSRWLGAEDLEVRDLNEERVEDFLSARRKAGYTGLRTSEAMVPLLGFLRASGMVPSRVVVPASSAVEVLHASFSQYLLSERGLAASTAAAYVARIDRFLAGCAPDGDLARLSAADVTRSVLEETVTRKEGSVQFFVVAVRTFLKFCSLEGLIEVDLSAAAPSITGRRQQVLPQGIKPEDASALLLSCDRSQTIGKRDHAVLLLLLRLGLRAIEVARLRLDDIDWRAGQMVIRGKGERQESLPLPAEVGESVAGYLQNGRPGSVNREVFLTVCAPLMELKRGSVSLIVRRACVRAGITPMGAHRLRHALACEMVAAGASLPEIGQVLRHRHLSSTTIYAKTDILQLRGLALQWPSGGSL
jgi:site-specific recombinase XerD